MWILGLIGLLDAIEVETSFQGRAAILYSIPNITSILSPSSVKPGLDLSYKVYWHEPVERVPSYLAILLGLKTRQLRACTLLTAGPQSHNEFKSCLLKHSVTPTVQNVKTRQVFFQRSFKADAWNKTPLSLRGVSVRVVQLGLQHRNVQLSFVILPKKYWPRFWHCALMPQGLSEHGSALHPV